jgi:hypothetical protein
LHLAREVLVLLPLVLYPELLLHDLLKGVLEHLATLEQ